METISQKLCSSSGNGEITGAPRSDGTLLEKAIPGEKSRMEESIVKKEIR